MRSEPIFWVLILLVVVIVFGCTTVITVSSENVGFGTVSLVSWRQDSTAGSYTVGPNGQVHYTSIYIPESIKALVDLEIGSTISATVTRKNVGACPVGSRVAIVRHINLYGGTVEYTAHPTQAERTARP